MGGVRDSHRGAGNAAPTNRALVIGSETGGLQGVHRDAEAIAGALTGLGFTVTLAIEGAATRDEIVARYRGLIEDSKADDAAVIYYSGHGGRQRNPLADSDPSVPAWFQFMVPTDINDMSSGFRGVLAEELSLLQLELTQKTRNVTAIFDCCHSARMSRDAGALPKADSQLPAFPWDDVLRRWEAARHDPRAQAAPGDSNPDAVRVVACSPDESAYELPNTPLGGRHGALTGTLVPVLQSAVARSLTWRGVLDYLRPAVLEMVPQQRPEIEGPLDRLLFRTETRDETGVLPVVVRNGVALLEGAALLGMAEGDTYDLVAPGADRAAPLTTATIDRIAGDQARLHLGRGAPASLPAGTSAYPVRVALGARPVAIVPAGDPRRASVVAALEGSPAVRLVEGTTNVMATVQIGDAGLQLLDPCGEPLLERPAPLDAVGYTRVATDLRLLARATHVRELASGAGPAELPDDVTIGCTRLLPDGTEVALTRSGEHLFAGDRVVVRIRNQSAEKRFVNVVDVGVAGAVCVVTSAEPGGTTLEAGEAYVLGESGAGARTGIELRWPEQLPAGGPRPETLVVITSDAKVDGVARLAQAGARDAGGGPPAATALDRLLDGATSGRRDFRLPPAESRPTRYRVQRVDFVLHSEPRVGEADEPAFEVDERPDPSFRLVTPRGAEPPARVAVRLKELTVHSNRALLSAAVRIDALVVTAPPEGSGEPYTAATARFDRVKDGDRLPFDDLLVYEGPVGRFVDLAVWVTKDDQRELDLADLLVKETGDMDLKGAVATLAGLAATAPQAAAVAGAAAAVAVVVRTGARLLDTLEGKSIGVYRTSLLPHQRFGASDQPPGAGRHPAQGLIRAQDMSFAFEVVDLSLVDIPSPPTAQSPTQGGDAP